MMTASATTADSTVVGSVGVGLSEFSARSIFATVTASGTIPQQQPETDAANFELTDEDSVRLLEALYSFKVFYESFHRYISLMLCVLGIIANIIHVCVLTRPKMRRRSSVNATLTCVAIADIGTMASYLIYIIRFEFFMDLRGYGYAWASFLRAHASLSVALHAVSIYFVVFMAFIRLHALDVASSHSRWVTNAPKFAYTICSGITVIIILLCIPTYLAHQIYEQQQPHQAQADGTDESRDTQSMSTVSSVVVLPSLLVGVPEQLLREDSGRLLAAAARSGSMATASADIPGRIPDALLQSLLKSISSSRAAANDDYDENSTLITHQTPANSALVALRRLFRRSGDNRTLPEAFYRVGFSDDFLADNCALLKFNLWLTGLMLKAVPCFLLLCFTIALLRRLRANEQKRRLLLHRCGTSGVPLSTRPSNHVPTTTMASATSQHAGVMTPSTSSGALATAGCAVDAHRLRSLLSTCGGNAEIVNTGETNNGDDYNSDSRRLPWLRFGGSDEHNAEQQQQLLNNNAQHQQTPAHYPHGYLSRAETRHGSTVTTCSGNCNSASTPKISAADRTTYILLLMLTVFLLTELPQGIFAMMNAAFFAYQFHGYVYMSIADVLDLLSLINCQVAFVIYMLTSSVYRKTLVALLHRGVLQLRDSFAFLSGGGRAKSLR